MPASANEPSPLRSYSFVVDPLCHTSVHEYVSAPCNTTFDAIPLHTVSVELPLSTDPVGMVLTVTGMVNVLPVQPQLLLVNVGVTV